MAASRSSAFLPLLLILFCSTVFSSSPSPAAAETSLLKQLPRSSFSGFLSLVEHADLLPELEASLKAGKGVTVFAPTDDVLVHQTSPTLLAYLKLAENKEALRQILRSHVVPARLSPFQWDGTHKTLSGSDLPLSLDSQSFFAGHLAVLQYNALVASDGACHSIPSFIIPEGLSLGHISAIQAGTNDISMRRVLAGALAPAPTPAFAEGPIAAQVAAYPPPPPKSASASAPLLASVLTLLLAAIPALALL